MCHQDGKAARTGAQVECAGDRVGVLDPGREPFVEQFGKEGARHDHTFIDVEAEIPEPGFLDQIGRGYAFDDAALDVIEQCNALIGRNAGVEEGVEAVDRERERGQDQPCGFVENAGDAVSAKNLAAIETGDGVA